MITLQNGLEPYNEKDTLSVLKARIALLATAIGGPDYSSRLDPPPYKLGDDCLSCLKDLKRWFKLVDEQQNRWDVAMAAAEYRILTDDLLPILIDWENKSSLANKISKKNSHNDENSEILRSRELHDSIALNSLQLIVILTWPLVLNDQSTADQVRVYSDLKKYQLVYKKSILISEKGKALKAATRLASKVIRMDKSERTPRDNSILRLTLNLFRNILSIEPGELNIATNRGKPVSGINATDTMPPNVTLDDISLNAVISAFHNNKVLGLLLLLSGSSNEFDNDFIDVPLMEILFYLTKELKQEFMFEKASNKTNDSDENNSQHQKNKSLELSELLKREKQLKKNVIQNTSTRHSRFGALLSIQTVDNGRLTVSGGGNLLDDHSALNEIDSRKKWNKRGQRKRDDPVAGGLPTGLLGSQKKSFYFNTKTISIMKKFIETFVDTGFNPLLHRLTSHYTTEQDQLLTLEQVEYLLFFAWFVKCQRIKNSISQEHDVSYVVESIEETTFILVSSMLRKSYEEKNWSVTHAGMIAFDQLLKLVGQLKESRRDDSIEFILGRLFSDERLKLLSDLPKQAYKHSIQYMKSCVDMTHSALKIFEQYNDEQSLIISKKNIKNQNTILEEDINFLVESQGIDRDEALEILQPSFSNHEVNFAKIQRYYICDSTLETYINFLQRYEELEESYIKKGISFLHRVVTQASEESLLFRLDFIMLLRDMLSPNGISRSSSVRKHVDSFASFFLHRLKKRLKSSSSWFMGMLFPLLHSGEAGYFQRYGEKKSSHDKKHAVVTPSIFRSIDNEQELPESHIVDLRYGILVATLIDEDKIHVLTILVDNLKRLLELRLSFLSFNIQNENDSTNPPNEFFKWEDSDHSNPHIYDPDFRALLALIGYHIPENLEDRCYMPGSVEITDIQHALDTIKKYMSTPFQTPNGLPSATYLIRKSSGIINTEEDGWYEGDISNYQGAGIVSDDAIDEAAEGTYFNDLDNDRSENVELSKLNKGIARSKKSKKTDRGKSKSSKRVFKSKLPTFDIDEIDEVPKAKERHFISSKEYISDSDDENEIMNPIFFENEMYMRFLLDKFEGQLSEEKYKQFGKFAAERMANDRRIISDFSGLFGGKVPEINLLHQVGHSSVPDKSLISLSKRVSKELNPPKYTDSHELIESELPIMQEIHEHVESISKPNSSGKITNASHMDTVIDTHGKGLSQDLRRGISDIESEDSEPEMVSRKRAKIFVEDDDE